MLIYSVHPISMHTMRPMFAQFLGSSTRKHSPGLGPLLPITFTSSTYHPLSTTAIVPFDQTSRTPAAPVPPVGWILPDYAAFTVHPLRQSSFAPYLCECNATGSGSFFIISKIEFAQDFCIGGHTLKWIADHWSNKNNSSPFPSSDHRDEQVSPGQ